MIFLNILAAVIGLFIGLLLYIAVSLCVSTYRWRKLKRRVIEAVEALDLWDVIEAGDPIQSCPTYKAITTFLDAHNYSHCFYGRGGAFCLMQMLSEIMSKRKQSK